MGTSSPIHSIFIVDLLSGKFFEEEDNSIFLEDCGINDNIKCENQCGKECN